MMPKVFIDGEAGTTGLQIRDRLAARRDIALVSIDPVRRKDASARAEMINSADVVILCLPDDAAREAVALITNPKVKVIDASTAHRIAPDWAYGFPEMAPDHRAVIAGATRVANTGCYAVGAVALLRPLVSAGVLPADYPLTINAVSGYSGGGKSMITEFENASDPTYTKVAYRIYALELKHKHVPEIQKHSGLALRPIFTPGVGRYAQGMIVEVPLHLAALPSKPDLADLHTALTKAYHGAHFVEVVPLAQSQALKTLQPEELNNTNRMKLFVFGAEGGGQARLVALLDNLGKGAAGQAVQNMNIILGFPEAAGLS
jgi:N-acetyl-gamma-glutamyl-phosphate reductase